MNIYELLFFFCFISIIIITFAKIYNIMKEGKFYDKSLSWILAIAFLVFYGVSFMVQMIQMRSGDLANLIYLQLFRFESFLILLNFLFLIFEHFFEWGYIASKQVKPYMSQKR